MSNQILDTVNAAGFFLLIREGENLRFLLLQHANRWDLPKGHCDPGESFLETAIRELREETGINRDELEIDPSFSFEVRYPVQYHGANSKSYNKRVKYFLAFLSSMPTVRVTEHLGARWIDWDPSLKVQAETIDPMIDAVATHLRGGLPKKPEIGSK